MFEKIKSVILENPRVAQVVIASVTGVIGATIALVITRRLDSVVEVVEVAAELAE